MKRTSPGLFLLLTVGAWGQQADIPKSFAPPTSDYDYEKREVMILMRDGVKLHTVIVVPKGARHAPILLTRTPYNASKRASRNERPHILATLPWSDEVFVNDGYIRVYQDVRGKYKSEGAYLMTRPVRGPLNDSSTDHVTDVRKKCMPPAPAFAQQHTLSPRLSTQRRTVDGSGKRVGSLQCGAACSAESPTPIRSQAWRRQRRL